MARIAGVDLPRNKMILYALPYIHGFGMTGNGLLRAVHLLPIDNMNHWNRKLYSSFKTPALHNRLIRLA